MIRQKPTVIFMGTPYFAVPSLEILLQNDYHVKAVVTAADKPSGRGLKVRESAVKTMAIAHGIPVLQPLKLKDDAFEAELRKLSADIFVVVAFRMLPEKIWSIPPMGTINLHASLLPFYRGAAPINHAIINGETTTGVTTFLIEKEIDTGKVLMQEETIIYPTDSAGTLHDRLMMIGAGLLFKTLESMKEGTVEPRSQKDIHTSGHHPLAPKITRADCRIKWVDPVTKIYNFVRGLSPYPAAWTTLHSDERIINIKVYEIQVSSQTHTFPPGKVVEVKGDFVVAAGEGSAIIKTVQAEGRKVMTGSEFIKGFRPDKDAFCE